MECDECSKEIPIAVPYYSVCLNKEKECKDREIEVLESEQLLTLCEDCFKKVNVSVKREIK